MRNCVLPIATLLTVLAIVTPGCMKDYPLRGALKSHHAKTAAR